MKIREIMTSKDALITLAPDVKLIDAAERMVHNKVGSVIVIKDSTPLGIVTEKDIVRIAQQSKDLAKITLEDIMSFPVITISKEQDVRTAAEMMYRNRIHHLVVIDENSGVLEGIISSFDILKVFFSATSESDD